MSLAWIVVAGGRLKWRVRTDKKDGWMVMMMMIMMSLKEGHDGGERE